MSPKPLNERILDAVEQCFVQYGIQKTTLQDVADRCGVSRMTVYRHFKDRQALFDGAVLRNIARHWDYIGERLSKVKKLDKWLVEALVIYQMDLCQDPAVKLYLSLDAMREGFIVAMTDNGLAAITDHMAPLFDAVAVKGKLANGLTQEDIAEWVHRTNYSLMQDPSPRLATETQLRRWLSAQVSTGLIP